jgi:hypothetical protein
VRIRFGCGVDSRIYSISACCAQFSQQPLLLYTTLTDGFLQPRRSVFTVSRVTVQAVGHHTLTTEARVQSQASPCETHGRIIEIMTSSTSLHATAYNDAMQNLGLVWVVISTWLTASSYRQYFYSRPVTGMLHMLYKLQKKKSGMWCPIVFTVGGPMVMAHKAENTVLI